MATMNSSVLACSYTISSAGCNDLNAKLTSIPSVVSIPLSGKKLPMIKAQKARVPQCKES
ncbi:hypothetical protein TanjilG_31297 [Lupinus angustifolius]|uniref:Uncharacterized protein n=1 Tax=Lupinus angustifolius TaxID=3871 RepID=A0A4P1RTP4_LUPAN|nr:hypothetical protein TanjilG_31297 [Lupinus angustifolius]